MESQAGSNRFSEDWFRIFHDSISSAEKRAKLASGGRFIVDVYNREALERTPRERIVERGDQRVRIVHGWSGRRLTAELEYSGAIEGESFEWRIYTPDELASLAESVGFSVVTKCAWFDEGTEASPEHARMQFVLER